MVDNNRILPGLLIALTIFIFYLIELDYFFFSTIVLFSFFDFVKSKTLTTKKMIFFLVITFFIFLSIEIYNLSFNKNVYLFFFIILVAFFIFKEVNNYLFVILNLTVLIIIFYLLKIDRNIIFLIILLSFINDTTAYLIGRNIKGPLIFPNISPKKTWSGTLGSLSISFCILLSLNYNIVFSLIVSLSFFLGDIFFSYYKRTKFIKDFSNLFYGHGGFLDRFDSIFFPILFFSFILI